MKLWVKILIGFGLGIITGLFFGDAAQAIKPVGDIFIDLINMVVTLLIFSSMTLGITSIHDPEKLGRVGLKTLLVYAVTTIIAIVIGLAFAKLIQPGVGVNLQRAVVLADVQSPDSQSLSEILFNVIPRNPIASLAEGNILQVIVFSIFLGLAINFAGEKGKPLLGVIESLADVMYRLTSIVMEFAPYGVFAFMAWVAGSFGVDVLISLAWFLLTNYLACFTQVIVVHCGLLWFFARLNPIPFFRGMGDAIVFAVSTSSSSATLPVTMHCAEENLGVSRNISSFVLPLGSTVNMNGAALSQGITAVFIAQAYGIDLSWQALVTVVVTATLSAVGAAGVPGSSYLMLSATLGSVGLPLEGMSLVVGVDRIREMVTTAVNIMGDAVAAVYVAKTEGELDEEQYAYKELVELDLEA